MFSVFSQQQLKLCTSANNERDLLIIMTYLVLTLDCIIRCCTISWIPSSGICLDESQVRNLPLRNLDETNIWLKCMRQPCWWCNQSYFIKVPLRFSPEEIVGDQPSPFQAWCIVLRTVFSPKTSKRLESQPATAGALMNGPKCLVQGVHAVPVQALWESTLSVSIPKIS